MQQITAVADGNLSYPWPGTALEGEDGKVMYLNIYIIINTQTDIMN